jgi:hypothetical protein
MRKIFCAVMLGGLITTMQVQACETDQDYAAINTADTTRIMSGAAKALDKLKPLLAAKPPRPRAQYVGALILMDLAGKDAAKAKAALAQMVATADGLTDFGRMAPTERACKENSRLYTIFNSVGFYFFQQGDKVSAEKYWMRGQSNAAALDQKGQAKLYGNLGLINVNKLNLSQAQIFYSKAQAAGNPTAAVSLAGIQQLRVLNKK